MMVENNACGWDIPMYGKSELYNLQAPNKVKNFTWWACKEIVPVKEKPHGLLTQDGLQNASLGRSKRVGNILCHGLEKLELVE